MINKFKKKPQNPTGEPTVLAGFALLTLPAAPNALGDLDVGPGVEVVLAARRAVQQVLQLGRGNLRNLNV